MYSCLCNEHSHLRGQTERGHDEWRKGERGSRRGREREGDMMNGGKGERDYRHEWERKRRSSYTTIFFSFLLGATSQVHPVEWP